jgi:hypothetical protein
MRRAIAFITTRYGIAGLIALIVLAVLIGAKIFGPATSHPPGPGSVAAAPVTSTDASEQGAPDDGLAASTSPSAPVVKPGRPGPLEVATSCANAWLAHGPGVTSDQWWKAVTRYTTGSLAAKLKGVDPQGVPASRITTAAQLADHGATWANVVIKVDSGALTLRMLSGTDGWQVDGIDWTRS